MIDSGEVGPASRRSWTGETLVPPTDNSSGQYRAAPKAYAPYRESRVIVWSEPRTERTRGVSGRTLAVAYGAVLHERPQAVAVGDDEHALAGLLPPYAKPCATYSYLLFGGVVRYWQK